MRCYRIGDFAKRMGVSTHLLKHYEDEGIITPEVRANGYRFYGLRDSSVLLQCRMLRNLGFPVREMKTLLNEEDSDQTLEHLAQRADALEQELARKRLLLAEMQRQRALTPRIAAGEEGPVEAQGAWYLPHVAGDCFLEGAAGYVLLQAWTEWMPIVCSCLRIFPQALAPDVALMQSRDCGLIVSAQAAQRCGIPTGAPAEYVPPRRVWRRYASIPTGPEGQNCPVYERALLEDIRAAGETPCGQIYKTVLLYTQQNGNRFQHCILEVELAPRPAEAQDLQKTAETDAPHNKKAEQRR